MSAKYLLHPLLLLCSLSALADASSGSHVGGHAEAHASRHAGGHADGHAPLGVMGDHLHKTGEFMFSYRFMRMEMDGNRDGEDDLSPQEVLAQGYMATPLEMTTDMHMFGAMYAPNDALTLMAMLPLVEKSMDHVNAMGTAFTTETEGLGDLKLSGLIRWVDNGPHKAHFNLGLSLPVGSIDKKDRIPTPMGPSKVRLPYAMQIGSGTTDLLAGVTYNRHLQGMSWGAQGSVVKRLESENDNGYALGDELQLTSWLARNFNQQFSGSVRLAYKNWGNVDGADPSLNPNMVPTADPDLRGGERIDLGLGLNWLGASGHRLALEWLAPVMQDLDGPQLKSDDMLIVGWQKAF